ncbi:MAG: PQQ-binding-like beta-propeller repeat protein [Roseibacillus sp.]|jgi:outer membrane protein assembly factor BamB
MNASRPPGFFRLAGVLAFAACSTLTAQDHWPQFRGADSLGVGTNRNLPDKWSATENVEWKTDLPGRGWSCPIVWGDRVFLTTVINEGKTEDPKKGLYFGGERPKFPDTVHQWKVYCLDLKSGKIRWEKEVHKGKPQSAIHVKNSYASETPVTDGERVYCYFGNVGVFVFDLDGNPQWSKKFTPHKTRHSWGTAASPVLHKDRLYILNDNEVESSLLALDTKTGDQVWKIVRDEKSNWSNPFIWKNKMRTEIVVSGTGRTRSYDLNGKELWSYKGMSSITIATPYASDGLLYISSGYVGDRKKPIYAIRPGASGDISLVPLKGTSGEFIAWCNWKASPYNPSTLIYDKQLYSLLDRGWIRTLDPKTGAYIYEGKRLPPGAGYTVSPWAYNGKVFCLNEDGETHVLKAGREFELLHTNKLAEDDMAMACPAMAGDRLLIRTAARVYCIRNSK